MSKRGELLKLFLDHDLSFETFAQHNKAMDFAEEAVYPWIKLIYETGKIFRNKIEE